jgi:hypothetical protein
LDAVRREPKFQVKDARGEAQRSSIVLDHIGLRGRSLKGKIRVAFCKL